MKVYLALTRPKLKRGAEWKLTSLNGLLVIAMICFGILSHWWWIFLTAAMFYWPGQWLLRQAAKHDPQWMQVYARSLSHPLVREPHGFAFTRDGRPKPILPRMKRWML